MNTSTILAGIGWAAAGAAAWTLLEYVIHKNLGHRGKGSNPFGREHLRHHATTHYFAPNWKKALAALAAIGLFTGLLWLPLGLFPALCFATGLGLMYISYEVVHRRCHTHPPTGPYGRWVRRNHFYHHFRNPNLNHGVTSPFWDMVFRTYVPPEKLRIPPRHVMTWLCDESGDVRARSSRKTTRSSAAVPGRAGPREPPPAIIGA